MKRWSYTKRWSHRRAGLYLIGLPVQLYSSLFIDNKRNWPQKNNQTDPKSIYLTFDDNDSFQTSSHQIPRLKGFNQQRKGDQQIILWCPWEMKQNQLDLDFISKCFALQHSSVGTKTIFIRKIFDWVFVAVSVFLDESTSNDKLRLKHTLCGILYATYQYPLYIFLQLSDILENSLPLKGAITVFM